MGNAVIFYDGVCNLCSAWVRFVIKHDCQARFRFAPLQSEYAARLLEKINFNTKDADSVVLLEHGKLYLRSTAALRIARHLNGAWPLTYALIIVPRFARDAVYEWVARHRYRWFGKMDNCEIPSAEVRERFLG